MKNLKTKIGIKKTLLTLVGIPIVAGMIALGCSPERLDGTKKPKIEYPGMSPYNIKHEGTDYEVPDIDVISYAEKLLHNTRSAKKGLTSKIPLDGELVSLKTFYGLGVYETPRKMKEESILQNAPILSDTKN